MVGRLLVAQPLQGGKHHYLQQGAEVAGEWAGDRLWRRRRFRRDLVTFRFLNLSFMVMSKPGVEVLGLGSTVEAPQVEGAFAAVCYRANGRMACL